MSRHPFFRSLLDLWVRRIQSARSGRQLLFQKHCSGFIQNAVPARPISQIQTHRQSLTCNFSDLTYLCGANLFHYRFPLSLALRARR